MGLEGARRWAGGTGIPDAGRQPPSLGVTICISGRVTESPEKECMSGPSSLSEPRPGAIPYPYPTDSVLYHRLQRPSHASSLKDHEPFAYSCDPGRVPSPLGLSFPICKQHHGTICFQVVLRLLTSSRNLMKL